MRTIQFRGLEHENAHDALVELNFSGDRAICVGKRYFTIDHTEFERLQIEERVTPTTLHHHEPTGRIMTVPGNV